ncbi:efflux RND transporter periplasmic adaptor subunit [Salinibius halmophilus]|uniref:efflux RND transporter periplasmic adaptor subunit n=1 Tax=Salinibius halmophilus TaxID=1853216 RepID=UPI000E662735|nr:HlyD family efflux transporter periplasmic adaptor subunit [Salinibius halmophilus]
MKPSNIIFKGVLPLGVLGASVFAFAALTSQPPQVETITEEKIYTVDTLPVLHQAQRPQLELYGMVHTPKQQLITSEVTGKLLRVLVEVGDQVEPGDLLMEVDDFHAQQAVANQRLQISQINSQLLQNEQQKNQAEQELVVQKRLLGLSQNQLAAADNMLNRKLISDIEHAAQLREFSNLELTVKRLEGSIELADIQHQQLTLQKELAQNELINLERMLANTSIIAPVAGQVIGNLPTPGQLINNGMQVAQLVQTDQKEVQVQLPAHLSRQLENTPTIAFTDAGTRLVLDRIAAQVEPGMVGRTAFLKVVDHGDRLTAGDTTRIILNLPAINNVIAVPAAAVFDDKRVYEVVDGALEAVEFEHLGSMIQGSDRHILIQAAALENGDQLLATRIANVTSGMKVKGAGDE